LGTRELRIIGVPDLPEVTAGDCLGKLIATALRQSSIDASPNDIFVVTQKIASKAEGRVVRLDKVKPSPLARAWADAHGKDSRLIEIVLSQTRRIVRMERGHLIVENRQGFVCANAGVDSSNVSQGTVSLLPEDCDRSARRIRKELEQELGVPLSVILSDTFGRPWRRGLVDVALGVSGLAPLLDHRGNQDSFGIAMEGTIIAVADELASAAELVMGKAEGIPVAVIRGFDYNASSGGAQEIIRPAQEDLFR
jgi:coenzyme F420-0:L-glutamate ligase/coenzyme F420-1:gamma-L-glutamate ligase